MFKAFTQYWKHMSGLEKVKFVLDIMTDVGAGALTGTIVRKNLPEGRVARICSTVAGMGAAIAVGEVCEKAINNYVDTVDQFVKSCAKDKKEA